MELECFGRFVFKVPSPRSSLLTEAFLLVSLAFPNFFFLFLPEISITIDLGA